MKTAASDTAKCRLLSALIDAEYDDNVWPLYNKRIEEICLSNLENLSLDSVSKRIFKADLGACYSNFGYINKQHGDIPTALENYFKGLKILEEIGDKKGKAETLNNIGFIYKSQNESDKALEYFNKCLDLQKEINNKGGVAFALSNIGYIYDVKAGLEKVPAQKEKLLSMALDFDKQSLAIHEELQNIRGIAHCQHNIGYIYLEKGDTMLALENLEKSLAIRKELNDKHGMSQNLNTIGLILFEQGKIKQALKDLELSLETARENKFAGEILNSSKTLSKVYSRMGNWKSAYEMQVLYKLMSDSISNEKNQKDMFQKGYQYEYEKKAAADRVRVAEEKKVIAAELKQEKTQKFALYGGLAFMLVFAGFIFNRFRNSQRQKRIIEMQKHRVELQKQEIQEQKDLVDEKHKEITDSINYAERIQRSFLATKELLDENLKDYFVFFQPKDVVSGDFYWAAKLHNDKFALVTADSTGHGVPGAIMSLLNITSLEKAVESYIKPSDILNSTRKTIITRLKKDGSAEGGKDGMDASLIVFDFENHKITYSAANNPIWVVRPSTSSGTGGELIELKPDKMPVGKHDKDSESFKQGEFELRKNDVVYMLTDGMPDQFGGPKGKKFMYKQLKELLISISSEPMETQKQIIQNTLNDWKGSNEQVDDITLIGIRA